MLNGPGYLQVFCDLPGDALDPSDSLDIDLLRREKHGGITGMNTGKFNVFGNCIADDLPVPRHSIHFDLLGILDESRNHDGILF